MDNTNSNAQTSGLPQGEPHLKRVLGLKDLVFYGIVLNQPVAAIGLFGLVSQISKGHMVTTLLFSMVAMLLTALSYGRMAALYPSAGSAYTYVSRGINSSLGFLAGWAMILCYLVIPMINTVFGVLSLQRLFPGLPYVVGVVIFMAAITLLNILGVRSSMKANKIMLYVMMVIILVFIVAAIRYILRTLGLEGLVDTKPLYNSETFSLNPLFAGTALVALTYVGFDGITTLAEDVKKPKRDIKLAILIVCIFTGLFSALQMYLAQQSAHSMWLENGLSGSSSFYDRIPGEHIETAFMTVCAQVGGSLLFNAMTVTMVIACLGSGLAGQLGAARLLYGMGNDGIIPKKFFSHLGPKYNSPVYNLLIIGVLAIVGALLLNYQKVAELINFAALIAFMGVNIAAINRLYFRSSLAQRNLITDLAIPAAGFLFCLWIWMNLPNSTMMMGGVWFLIGAIYLAVTTKGFRKQAKMLDFKDV
jgi:amino acid transporter